MWVFVFLGCVGTQNNPTHTITDSLHDIQDASTAVVDSPIKFDYWPSYQAEENIIIHTNYMLIYSEENEQALWVAYELSRQEVEGSFKRKDAFREDPAIESGSAKLSDYRNSGYDRGHLAPAGDMKFSEVAMSESFFMSNMSPQLAGFNRGVWKKLEEQVRDWAVENELLYVVTGGVLSNNLETIGASEVAVPEYYYKVLLDYTEPDVKAIAFLMTNEKSSKPLAYFAVSIDSVESVTGIDFFPALPDEVEDALEGERVLSGWFQD